MSLIPNTVAELEGKTYAELLEIRAQLVAKGNGKPSELSDDDLTILVNCFSLLRRRTSGPPAEKKKAAAKPAASLGDLLGL